MVKGDTDSRQVTPQRGHFINTRPFSTPDTQLSALVGNYTMEGSYVGGIAMVNGSRAAVATTPPRVREER